MNIVISLFLTQTRNNMSKTILFMLFTLAVAGVNANSAEDSIARQIAVIGKGSSYNVIYNGLEKRPVHIEILATDGTALYDGYVTKSKFNKPFDLSQLPRAEYTFRISDGVNEYREVVVTRDEINAFVEHDLVDQNKYKVAVYGAKGKTVSVFIQDQNGELVFEDRISHPKDFMVKYDVSNIKSDNLNFYVFCDGIQLNK